MSEWQIEQVSEVDDDILEATIRLMPELGSGNQVSVNHEYLERVVSNNANIWLVAKSSNERSRIVGMAVLIVFELPTNIRALLENVVVDADERGKGVGRALVARAVEEADRRLVNTIRASTGSSNTASKDMLQSAGFKSEEPMS